MLTTTNLQYTRMLDVYKLSQLVVGKHDSFCIRPIVYYQLANLDNYLKRIIPCALFTNIRHQNIPFCTDISVGIVAVHEFIFK